MAHKEQLLIMVILEFFKGIFNIFLGPQEPQQPFSFSFNQPISFSLGGTQPTKTAGGASKFGGS